MSPSLLLSRLLGAGRHLLAYVVVIGLTLIGATAPLASVRYCADIDVLVTDSNHHAARLTAAPAVPDHGGLSDCLPDVAPTLTIQRVPRMAKPLDRSLAARLPSGTLQPVAHGPPRW